MQIMNLRLTSGWFGRGFVRVGAVLGLGVGWLSVTAAEAGAPPIVIENDHVRYAIAADGTNLEFTDRASNQNYLRGEAPSVCAVARVAGGEQPATSVSFKGGRMELGFGASGTKVVLRVEPRPSSIRFTVEYVTGPEPEWLVFLHVPLSLRGTPDEPFGACAFSLNLQTRVDALPALQRDLRASCFRKFGLGGAKAALVGMPMDRMLPALKEVLTEADEMPLCPVAGPWAQEIPFNHGSYLFNFGALTESTVADWIAMARSLGVTQIDNHGGSGFFRFGDFELNREKWPEGWDTYRRIVRRLHEAGIGSIFHSYAFFIDKQSRYVTPVPDPRLDAFRVFTLAATVTPEATEILVREPTRGLSTVTGFFEHNSVVLHLGDELVTFSGVSQEPPWRFSGLKRGAFKTRAAAHEAGSTARHLKECFGLFVPNVETSLFEEIARNHADVVNACGFDGIYLDAIDGSSILRGGDECWYWADKFIFEIQRRLKKPVGMEMSAMWHHFWQYRTRWQAWDYPQRGHKRFIDLHAQAVHGGLLLPLHLGWWNFQTFDPPQVEPTYPDVIEYLGAKLIGWDAGISLAGSIAPQRLKDAPLIRRAVDILRTCEELRRSDTVPATVRAQLRQAGQEYSLIQDSEGAWRFRPTASVAHTLAVAEPWSLAWEVENPFEAQPLAGRLEGLISTGSPEDSVVVLDPSAPNAFAGPPRSAAGVSARLVSVPPVGVIVATHSGQVPARGAWVRLDRRFDPPLDLKERQALAVTVDGDGQGEIVAIRLESPHALAFGAVADHYLTVDFTGRRAFTLVETESARWNDYVWDDGKSLYNVYREMVDFSRIDAVSVWCNGLPPGKEVRCAIGPIRPLALKPCLVRNPAVTLNGETLTFPVEIPSGGFLEFAGVGPATLYGPNGEAMAKVTPQGQPLTLRPGRNVFRFSCGSNAGPSPRARLVVMSHGQTLGL